MLAGHSATGLCERGSCCCESLCARDKVASEPLKPGSVQPSSLVSSAGLYWAWFELCQMGLEKALQ